MSAYHELLSMVTILEAEGVLEKGTGMVRVSLTNHHATCKVWICGNQTRNGKLKKMAPVCDSKGRTIAGTYTMDLLYLPDWNLVMNGAYRHLNTRLQDWLKQQRS
jgi:hypothetical protein